MDNHQKPDLTFILLLLYLFVTGCSAILGGAAPGVAIHEAGKKSEDNYVADINFKHPADVQSPAIKEIEALSPFVPQENQTKAILFSKPVITFPEGEKIGVTEAGTGCVPESELYWKHGNASIEISDEEFKEILREQFEKYNYIVADDPDIFLENESSSEADFLIAAKITDMAARICYPEGPYDDAMLAKGKAYIQVEWQIYSTKQQDIVLELITEGSSDISVPGEYGAQDILYHAFAMSVQNMLANDNFYHLVALDNEISTSKRTTELEEIMIPIKMLKRDQIDKRLSINDYQNAVVTIHTRAGHGSGFIITEDGYVLTNQHVVGGTSFVNIKLLNGREVKGEVVRTDKIGDVALIKLKKDLYPYVLLGNSSLLDIGDEAYGIGAPSEDELSQTVTRGIINSFRMEKGLRYILSDVTAHRGNCGGPLVSLQHGVVGICVSGQSYLDMNTGVALSQFIPIEDAITILHINDEEITIQNIEKIN